MADDMADNPLYKLSTDLDDKLVALDSKLSEMYDAFKSYTSYEDFGIDVRGSLESEDCSIDSLPFYSFKVSIDDKSEHGLYIDDILTLDKDGSIPYKSLTQTIIKMIELTAYDLGYETIQIDSDSLIVSPDILEYLGYQVIDGIGMKTLDSKPKTLDLKPSNPDAFLDYLKK